MTVRIRPAEPTDARALAEARWFGEEAALRESFATVEARWLEPTVEDLEHHVRGDLSTQVPPTATFVAEVEGTVAGGAQIGAHPDGAPGLAQLHFLYVLPQAWGTGAASALHRRALAHATEHGFDRGTLWVIDRNARARRFYEREGWVLALETMTTPNGLPLVRYRRDL